MITRRDDWPERLFEYVAARNTRPFKWGKGEQDCCSFAAGGVLAMTDVDLMADIPDYATADEADVILAADPLEALMDARLPRRESPSFALRGDVGLMLLDGSPTLALVDGAMLIAPGRRRLERFDRVGALMIAWAV